MNKDFLFGRLRRLNAKIDALWGRLPESLDPRLPCSGAELVHRDKTVFLLTGMSARRACKVLEDRLARDGFLVRRLDMGGIGDLVHNRGIEEIAERLGREIGGDLARYGAEKCAVIAVGAVGLAARYYVKRMGGDEECRLLVTLASPHSGAPPWLTRLPLRLLSRMRSQLVPGGPFLRRLNAGPFPARSRIVSIYARNCRKYPFPLCRMDAEGKPNAANIEFWAESRETALELLFRSDVYAAVRRELESALRGAGGAGEG